MRLSGLTQSVNLAAIVTEFGLFSDPITVTRTAASRKKVSLEVELLVGLTSATAPLRLGFRTMLRD